MEDQSLLHSIYNSSRLDFPICTSWFPVPSLGCPVLPSSILTLKVLFSEEEPLLVLPRYRRKIYTRINQTIDQSVLNLIFSFNKKITQKDNNFLVSIKQRKTSKFNQLFIFLVSKCIKEENQLHKTQEQSSIPQENNSSKQKETRTWTRQQQDQKTNPHKHTHLGLEYRFK